MNPLKHSGYCACHLLCYSECTRTYVLLVVSLNCSKQLVLKMETPLIFCDVESAFLNIV
jgi:hypothetical protein